MANTRRVHYDEHGVPIPVAHYAYGGAYSSGSQSRLGAILENPGEFTAAEVRVIMWYVFRSPGHLEPIKLTLQEIAEAVGITRQALRRIINHLEDRRILLARGSMGRTTFYAISPYLGGQGSGMDQRDAIRSVNPPEIPGTEIKPADVGNVIDVTSRRRTSA
ncbi:helix-turn-helix domain-containing protein [Streptomyces heilongjiangensis]|uniref:MarR family transcriptional regulator n=1 Tax=Streptomyces heilongjiangensis TaxID=945052 RepID=A0ABW1BIV6_9ACTN|nr:helix-turn-helix domain-containing protein [Streptomyces heilongjiangensis]MDC2951045.1 helix-turn-helix domain-containing protein [Streptomyces heilongjiangensis]